MFSLICDNFRAQVEGLKQVLRVSDAIRAEIFLPVAPGAIDPWAGIRGNCPAKTDWRIFDHCAAMTRLYAVFEQFVADLLTDYLKILPDLFDDYSELGPPIRNQHRSAVGQILQKWSEDGPYRKFTELGIVKGLFAGLNGQRPYSLLPDAFLIDPHNYKPAVIRRIFNYVGFGDCWAGVENASAVKKFINEQRDANESAETILKDIVDYRNSAAHTNVTELLSVDEIASYGDFLIHVCDALAAILKKEVLRRRFQRNQVVKVATVVQVYGRAIGVRMEKGSLSKGEELVCMRADKVRCGKVISIQKFSAAHDVYAAEATEELGLHLDCKTDEGDELFRIQLVTPVSERGDTDYVIGLA